MKVRNCRALVHAQGVLDSATDLVKVRLAALTKHAVDRELSFDPPVLLRAAATPHFSIEPRTLQIVAEGLWTAVRERITHLVAQAVAERIAAGEGDKWLESKRAFEQRAQREFDEYVRNERESSTPASRQARSRQGVTSHAKKSKSAGALRARLAALQLRCAP